MMFGKLQRLPRIFWTIEIHMKLLSRYLFEIVMSIKGRGFPTTIKIITAIMYDHFYDIRNGTKTCTWVSNSDLDIDEEKKQSISLYVPTTVLSFRAMMKKLNVAPGGIFLDIGCGKGRAMQLASEFGFTEVRGVELSDRLTKLSEVNIRNYKERNRTSAQFSVIGDDICNYTLTDDETFFYLFDPFDEKVLRIVIDKIKQSLQRKNRPVFLIYRTPLYRHVIDGKTMFILQLEYCSWGHCYAIYSNYQ